MIERRSKTRIARFDENSSAVIDELSDIGGVLIAKVNRRTCSVTFIPSSLVPQDKLCSNRRLATPDLAGQYNSGSALESPFNGHEYVVAANHRVEGCDGCSRILGGCSLIEFDSPGKSFKENWYKPVIYLEIACALLKIRDLKKASSTVLHGFCQRTMGCEALVQISNEA